MPSTIIQRGTLAFLSLNLLYKAVIPQTGEAVPESYILVRQNYQQSNQHNPENSVPNNTFISPVSGSLIPLWFNTPPFGAVKTGGEGDLFPLIRKDFNEKFSIPHRSAAGIFIMDTSNAIHFQFCVANAIYRYKKLNNVDVNIILAKNLLEVLRASSFLTITQVTFYSDGVKIRLRYAGMDFILDFDYDDTDFVFLTTEKDNVIIIKDCRIEDLRKTLELFNAPISQRTAA